MSFTAYYIAVNIAAFMVVYHMGASKDMLQGYLSGIGLVTVILLLEQVRKWINAEKEINIEEEEPTYDDQGEVYPRYENGQLILQAPTVKHLQKGKPDGIIYGETTAFFDGKTIGKVQNPDKTLQEAVEAYREARRAYDEQFKTLYLNIPTEQLEELKDCHDGPSKEHP